jgi:proteasome component ECM29
MEAQDTIETSFLESASSLTPDGSSTAHKDLLSLASEVGDPSLVYRFLSLAANNSRPAAFGKLGLNIISEDSRVNDVLAENPKIFPKLYRYKFHPNLIVQRCMREIWDTLVKDQRHTLEKYFDSVMEELLRSILAKDSKVREASCAAIASLITSTKFQRYEQYYSEIWERCFKVLDDMLPSVQLAAVRLAKVLNEILIRMLESGDSSPETSTTMLEKAFAFLLSRSGIESNAKQVQAFSLGVLLDIVKKASGTILRPFIPELVERLVAFSSDFEWEGINYVHLNASQYNTTAEEIDNMRLRVIRSSPLTEAIDRCLDLVTTENVEQLAKSIERAMKAAIALPSKVVCSRILVSMSLRHNLFEPYADRFLALLRKSIVDRNDTVSDSYATAAGYLARIASDTQIVGLINFARQIYQTSDSDRERFISGAIIEAISKYAADRVQDGDIPRTILPFVFIAMHDGAASVKDVYQISWENFVGRHRALGDSLSDTVKSIQEFLDSPRWNLKQAASRAIAEATNEHANNRDAISDATAEILWPALNGAMAGRSWEGKEVVLLAFTRFVCMTKTFWKEKRPDVKDEIIKVRFS